MSDHNGDHKCDRPQLLTAHEAAELLGLDVDELARMRAQGTGPEWGELTRRHIRYDRSEVEAYLARRRGAPAAADDRDRATSDANTDANTDASTEDQR